METVFRGPFLVCKYQNFTFRTLAEAQNAYFKANKTNRES